MTREEILALKPGRELDALVAEKVMGWDDSGDGEWRNEFDRPIESIRLWRPSTDISAAWEVVEKMNELDFSITTHSLGKIVTVYGPETNHEKIDKAKKAGLHSKLIETCAMTYGESVPEAVCKAALLVMIDKESEANAKG